VKIEQLVVQHLYKSKEVTLQGIGTFSLRPDVKLPAENDKEFVMPVDAIQFVYDPRSTEDDALINYIVQHTRKMKPLATSDLESYLTLSKQFLNIGKPLTIEGIGTIQKNQQGEYEFRPGVFVTPKIEDIPRQLKEKADEEISFESKSKRGNGQRNLMIALIILIVLILGGVLDYFIMKKKNEAAAQQSETIQPVPLPPVKLDTLKKEPVDTVHKIVTPATPPIIDSINFKIIIKKYADSEAINNAYKRLTSYGHKVVIYKTDSTYKLGMPFKTPLSDTAIARDSIKILFGGKPTIELESK
jgi:hypothetical protein